ncbi:Serine phosphatase RsbU, regulator of sigma subunit [Butyrivibrio sp. ob235]|uniref:PP2C family protein-serine/threonine phosphatase n=1 Tax=Butyrivibrio sp. ob235 TaxID=1761780 RepID=UPI0008CDA9F7|nr:PP2C family protein-serine/threonine phosphatase [Butyrivibrio sp. ob235]SEK25778.1 Serine phosphatase RsbU, regulator of sigma subunit [Butyrivibrio sp. ob235]
MSLSQHIHIALELWCAFFCGIAIVCVLASRFQDNVKSRLLIFQLNTIAFINLLEVQAYYFRGNTTKLGYYSVRIANFGVFFMNHLLLIFATHYICHRMGSSHSKGTKLTCKAITILCVIGIVLLILSRVFGFYYAFDDQNRYYRLNGTYWIMLFIQMLAMMILTGYTICHWRHLKKLEKVAYLSYELLPVLAIGVQNFVYGISLATLATTYSVLLMFVVYEIEYSEVVVLDKQRIEAELSLATSIQTSMLPHDFPPFPDRKEFDIFATTEPAREVGGDFYDYFLVDDDHLCIVMADVSGKGIPAALYMTISKVILKNTAILGKSVSEILTLTNDGLTKENNTGMFVTIWIGMLEISSGILTCANAGHEYPAIMRKGGSFEIFKDKHGFVLGGMEGVKYKEYTIQMNPGDRIFLYTDGVPEATNNVEDMYGIERMIGALNKEQEAPLEELLKNVRTDIGSFVRDAEQFDDLTMMCLEYRG